MAGFSWRGGMTCAASLAAVVLAAVISFAAPDDDESKPDDNPYLPREGLSAEELRDFIERMQRAPKTVQTQPGFTDAIGVAVDRLLAANPKDELRVFGLTNKMQALHRSAMYGEEAAQKRLMELVKQSKDTKDKELSKAIDFYTLEDRAIDAGPNAKTEDLPSVLDDLKKYFAAEPELDRQHMRLASATVKIINRVADDDLAQKSYKEFGELWAKSQELELGRYGRKIAKGTRKKVAEIVGKPMPFSGTTHDGKTFDVEQSRGKPVVVMFWATWCGPCKAMMPEIKAIYEHFRSEGVEVVGVSKDEDREALSAYLEQEEIRWPNLFDTDPADPEKHPISDQYGVHGIPSTFLLDQTGKVIAEDLHGEQLAAKIEELLDAKPGERGKSDEKEKAEEKPKDAPAKKE